MNVELTNSIIVQLVKNDGSTADMLMGTATPIHCVQHNNL